MNKEHLYDDNPFIFQTDLDCRTDYVYSITIGFKTSKIWVQTSNLTQSLVTLITQYESVGLKLYKFNNISVFNIQRYTSNWKQTQHILELQIKVYHQNACSANAFPLL